MTYETWYVLVTGEAVSPAEVAPDETGALIHASGVPVAMRGPVPSTRGVYGNETQKVTAEAQPATEPAAVAAKPARRGYKTRAAD